MNGKKAKMMRKQGKLDKRTKKLYNMLNAEEKTFLSKFYNQITEKKTSE